MYYIVVVSIFICLNILIYLFPKFFYILGIFLLYQGFGLLQSVTVPGKFRLTDLSLIFIYISAYFIWYKEKDKSVFILNGKLPKIFGLFLLYLILELFLTITIQKQDISLSILMFRNFLPIFIFFPTCIFIYKEENWQKYLKYVLIISIIGSILYIANAAFDLNIILNITDVEVQYIGIYKVNRYYGSIITGQSQLAASILLVYFFNIKYFKLKLFYLLGILLFTLHPLYSYGRGSIYSYFSQIIITLFFINMNIIKKISYTFLFIVMTILLITVFSQIQYNNTSVLGDIFSERILSASTDYTYNTGTYEIRESIVYERLLLVYDNPFFGVGFIHPESGLYRNLEGIIWTSHNGYVSLLGQFGFLGTSLYFILMLMLYKESYKVISLNNIDYLSYALCIATCGFVISIFPNMVSTDGPLTYTSLGTTGILAAIVFVTSKQNERKES